MRRALTAVVVVGLAVLAAFLPVPASPEIEDGELPPPPPPAEVPGLWYCAGLDDDADVLLAALTLAPARVRYSLPEDGGFVEAATLGSTAAGGALLDMGDVLHFYPGPAILEASAGPSAAVEIFSGPAVLAGSGCAGEVAKEWHLTGGIIDPGGRLTLRLFNPLLDAARVSVQVISEFGFEPITDFDGMSVPSRSWQDFRLEEILGERQQVSLVVVGEEGVVVPSLATATAAGVAVWQGSGLSRTWDFPVAGTTGVQPVVALRNPGAADATASIDVVAVPGTVADVVQVVVPATGSVRVPLEGLAGGEFGVVVRSDALLAAAVQSSGPGGIAAMAGLDRRAVRWLIPAAGSLAGADLLVWVINVGEEPTTVSVRSLDGSVGQSASLPAGTLGMFRIVGAGSVGAIAEAGAPVSVAWSLTAGAETAFGPAAPADG